MPIVIAVIIAVLAAVGAFFGVSALLGGSDTEGTIDECSIASDGKLTASGTVKSSSEVDTKVSVRFDDANTGTEVDRTDVDVTGAADESIPWTAEGQAGDEVTKVTCVLGPLD